jgi:hypothetical protein
MFSGGAVASQASQNGKAAASSSGENATLCAFVKTLRGDKINVEFKGDETVESVIIHKLSGPNHSFVVIVCETGKARGPRLCKPRLLNIAESFSK